MNDGVRIRFSVGLIFIAIVHALLLGFVLTVLHAQPVPQSNDSSWRLPSYRPSGTPTGSIEKLEQPIEVNLRAQGELKQQGPVTKMQDCPPQRVVVVPQQRVPVNRPSVSQAAPTSPTSTPATTTLPATTAPPVTPTPTKSSFQIALFVGGDSQSQQLQRWFSEHPQLAKLRQQCEFQVYTTSNAIYRTRFAQIVPADQFPVVLFQDNTGGHIHAAGRTMIPGTPEELYSDLRQGFELYQQAKQAQKTGALKTRGYRWDDAITPTMTLASQDCPDGYCPVEPVDVWKPGDRVRDLLFDRDKEPRDAFFWLSAGEIATLALIVVAVVLLGFILIKRGV